MVVQLTKILCVQKRATHPLSGQAGQNFLLRFPRQKFFLCPALYLGHEPIGSVGFVLQIGSFLAFELLFEAMIDVKRLDQSEIENCMAAICATLRAFNAFSVRLLYAIEGGIGGGDEFLVFGEIGLKIEFHDIPAFLLNGPAQRCPAELGNWTCVSRETIPG
jgi:hypothetical protein